MNWMKEYDEMCQRQEKKMLTSINLSMLMWTHFPIQKELLIFLKWQKQLRPDQYHTGLYRMEPSDQRWRRSCSRQEQWRRKSVARSRSCSQQEQRRRRRRSSGCYFLSCLCLLLRCEPPPPIAHARGWRGEVAHVHRFYCELPPPIVALVDEEEKSRASAVSHSSCFSFSLV